MNALTPAYQKLLSEVQYRHGTSGYRRKNCLNTRKDQDIQNTVEPKAQKKLTKKSRSGRGNVSNTN
jgi:hypothetical protein